MFNKIKNACKGAKRFVDKKIEACKEILSNRQNRLIIGLVLFGTGVGFIASAYIHAPA